MRKFFQRSAEALKSHPSLCHYSLAFLLPILALTVASLLCSFVGKGDFALIFAELEESFLPTLRALKESDSVSAFFAGANAELRAEAFLFSLSPLNLPMLIAPLGALRAAFTLSLSLRLGLAALSLSFFLRKIQCDRLPSLALSIAYAISSYAIVGAAYPSYLDVLILFPLVVLGILRISRKKGGALFGSALGLSVLLCPGAAVSLAVFSILLFAYFCTIAPLSKKEFFPSLAVFSGMLVLAVSAALAAFIPFLSLVKLSPSDYPFVQVLDFLDFCAKLLPGSFDGATSAHFPYLSVGVLPLLLSVVFFSTKQVPKRLRIATGGLWFLLFFTFSISAINGLYSLFIPTLPLYAHAYIFVFLLSATGAYAWRYLSEAHEKTLILSSGVIVLFAMILQKLDPSYDVTIEEITVSYGYVSELAILWIPALAAILFTAALTIVGRARALKKIIPTTIAILLVATVCFEGALSTYSLTKAAKKHAGQNALASGDFSKAFSDSVLSALALTEKDELYRVIASSALTKDDGLYFGYHSLTSMPEPLLSSLGIALDDNGCFVDASYPLALSILGVRHYIERIRIPISETKDGDVIYDTPRELPETIRRYFDLEYTVLGDEEEATSLFTSSLALPLIFASHSDLSQLSFDDGSSLITIINDYFRLATGDDSISLYDEIPPLTIFGTKLNINVPGHTVYDGNRIRFKATVKNDAPLYFTLTSAYPRESTVSITADGITTTFPLYESSESENSVTVPLGSFEAETLVEIAISFPNSADGRFYFPDDSALLWQENPESASDAIAILSSRSATDLKVMGDSLSAKIVTNDSESFILTTLPIDYNISVSVDGKKVETVAALGEFLAIPVSGAGEHRVTLTLSEPAKTLPTLLSTFGTVSLVALAVLEFLCYRGRISLPYLSKSSAKKEEENDAEVSES